MRRFVVPRFAGGIIIILLGPAGTAVGVNLPAPALTLDETTNTSPPGQTESSATGDWFGLRSGLEKMGITIGGLVDLDSTKVLRRGIDTDSTFVRYLLDFNLTLDTDVAFHWPGGTFFFDFQSHDGTNASSDAVGDVQGFDNLDAAHFVQIYQLWYQQKFGGEMFRVKAGKIDSNADFSVIEHGKEFLHSAATYSTTIFPIVTYPDPAPGADFFFKPSDAFYAGFGAFYSNRNQRFLDLSGHPQFIERSRGGSFLIAEAGSRWKIPLADQMLSGHAGVGAWYHSGEFARIDNSRELIHGSDGLYLFADQTLWSQDAGKDVPARDVGLFMNAGYADPRTSQIDEQLAGGLTASGFIPYRPADIVGVFGSWAHLPAQPDIFNRHELALEVFYKLQLFRWFSLKPDFQYIFSPSGKFPDAAVATLRAEIDF